MNCFEKVTVNAQAINWLKEKYPELCIKAGLCERIGGRLYTKTFIDPPAAQPEQQAEPVAWDKPSASFNEWWDSYRHDPTNPFAEGSAAYWAWSGWKSAQRQWVGLTDEDVNRESAPIASQMKLAFHAGMYVAQEILKEKNDLHKD